jgi:hypothetical protein
LAIDIPWLASSWGSCAACGRVWNQLPRLAPVFDGHPFFLSDIHQVSIVMNHVATANCFRIQLASMATYWWAV